MYAAIVTVILIPFFLIRRLSTIAIFSAVVLTVTFFAMIVVMYYAGEFIRETPAQTMAKYNMSVPAYDRVISWYGWLNLPVFIGGANNFYEGNFVTLTVYSEHNNPRNFFTLLAIVMTIYTVFISIVGYIGYFAWGNSVNAIILFNIPNHENLAIAAKALYFCCIIG
jgi:amino acid permease